MHGSYRNTLLYGCVQAVYFSWLTSHKVENDMSVTLTVSWFWHPQVSMKICFAWIKLLKQT